MSTAKKITKSILWEYKEKKTLYIEFAAAMENILSHLLKDKGYKHQISVRIKDESRLEEKKSKESWRRVKSMKF
jgi:hypothetical protein